MPEAMRWKAIPPAPLPKSSFSTPVFGMRIISRCFPCEATFHVWPFSSIRTHERRPKKAEGRVKRGHRDRCRRCRSTNRWLSASYIVLVKFGRMRSGREHPHDIAVFWIRYEKPPLALPPSDRAPGTGVVVWLTDPRSRRVSSQ